MTGPSKRRRRLERWVVLWLAVLNFLLWSHYARTPSAGRLVTSTEISSS